MMKNNIATLEMVSFLNQLDIDVQKITNSLMELVRNDEGWWKENVKLLVSQPLDSLKLHLTSFQDGSLSGWSFDVKRDAAYSILDPIESLIWLAGLCRVDRILIGGLPREFVDQYELQWRVLVMYWV